MGGVAEVWFDSEQELIGQVEFEHERLIRTPAPDVGCQLGAWRWRVRG